jgi:hypothetical protein
MRFLVFSIVIISTFLGSCTFQGNAEDALFQKSSSVEPKNANKKADTLLVYDENGILKGKHIYFLDEDDTLVEPKYSNVIKGYPIGDTIYGNFNKDKILDTAWVDNNQSEESQNGTQKTIIKFSDLSIPQLKIDNCPFLFLKNEQDLNSDGVDEIGVLPGGYNSACRSYHVFSLKRSKWMEACDPIPNSLNMREAGIVPIKRDSIHKGFVTIQSSYESSQLCNCQNCGVLEKIIKLY